jgi:hypothetical protein
VFIGVKISNGGKAPEFMHAFESALSILGTVVLFMHLYCSLLCDWYFFYIKRFRKRDVTAYVSGCVIMSVLIIFSVVYGEYSGLTGMRNTGIIFGVLWVWTLLIEWINKSHDACICPVLFFLSLFFWRFALYLNDHPEFITSIFTNN